MGAEKPKKPYPSFPLFPHPNGSWSKKICGKPRYFGPWADPEGALRKYLEQKDDLHAGREPRIVSQGPTVEYAINAFLQAKESLVKSGELSHESWVNYRAVCKFIHSQVSLTRAVTDMQPADFIALREKFAKGVGLVTLGIRIRITRMIFKYAYDSHLIPTPVRFGPLFRLPSQHNLRMEKNRRPKRMLEAADIRKLINDAAAPFQAMILLGVNCGFGNMDCARLPKSAVDLKRGWIDFPRPKTGVSRRCKLWPETVQAILDVQALERKPRSRADADLLFLTKQGLRYVRRDEQDNRRDGIGQKFTKMLQELNIKRSGVAFYTLRHVFETIGGDTRDQPAVDFIMGHLPPMTDMAARYRERIEDARIERVTQHIHNWLFASE